MSRPSRESRVNPDRRLPQTWLLAALLAATAACGAVAGGAVSTRNTGAPLGGQIVGAMLAILAMVGLPSVSIRFVARIVVVITGMLLVRFGVLTGSLVSGEQSVLVWVVATVTVFVLTDRLGTDVTQPLRAEGRPARPGPPGSPTAAPTGRVRPTGPGLAQPGSTARASLGVVAVVILLAVLLAPFALQHVGRSASPGDGPRGEAGSSTGSLKSTDRLDMTTRPKLGNEVVFTVATDRGTFWRGETFDLWDGQTWTRSQPERYSIASDGVVLPAVEDLGVNGTDEFTQRFRIESDYADVLYAAVSPVKVDSTRPVAQRFDGTLSTVGQPMGRGATYTVTSRRTLLSPKILRAADAGGTPNAIRDRYAAAPTTSTRVTAAAKRVTAGAPTTYDKILALEKWMGGRTRYSLDAPLSPKGVDVVDHFLFTSREGWCEQVASSLVVMARANGIPARLVTGFVPEGRDPVTGTYVVRARDAHAWAEVWFSKVGWVPFDPTASVPLAGADKSGGTIAQWLMEHAVLIVLCVVALTLAGWGLLTLWRRTRRQRTERPVGWAAHADVALDLLGRRVERARAPDETAVAYAAALAERYREPRLVDVGRLIDDTLYAVALPADEARAQAEASADALLAVLANVDLEPENVP